MSDVELLREAAQLMRERGAAATAGPWVVFDMDEAEHHKDAPLNGPGEGWYWIWAASRLSYYGGVLQPERDHPDAIIGSAAIDDGEGGRQEQADAEHIASWHPVVALAVADWLDSVGQRRKDRRHDEVSPVRLEDLRLALNVARAYLGTVPETTNAAPVGDQQGDDGELVQ